MPQGKGRKVQAHHSWVQSVEEGQGAVLLEVVEGNALLLVCPGQGQLSQQEQRLPQHPVGRQEERRVLHALGQAEELLSQLTRRLVLRPDKIKLPQSS